MHELSVAQGLCHALENVVREHGALRVRKAIVEMGPLANVVPELLVEAFATLRHIEPILAEAELEIRKIEMAARCEECGVENELDGFLFRCTHCGSGRVTLTRGEELTLRDVELEIEEEKAHESGSTRQDAGASAQVE